MTRDSQTKTATVREGASRDKGRQRLSSPSGIGEQGVAEIAGCLNALLADAFALYIKTKNFHWHVSGPHFRDYHLLFDEQAAQILAITDDIAERVRKLGTTTVRSIRDIAKLQRVLDNDADCVEAEAMLLELCEDNKTLTNRMREAKEVCDSHQDVATSAMIDVWVDEAERRAWFLFESARTGSSSEG